MALMGSFRLALVRGKYGMSLALWRGRFPTGLPTANVVLFLYDPESARETIPAAQDLLRGVFLLRKSAENEPTMSSSPL
jgi:hypothetical protein